MSIITNGNGGSKGPSITEREPVIITSAISDLVRNAILALLGFHIINWTNEQFALIMVLVGSLLTVFQIIVSRGRSTSILAPRLDVGTQVNNGASVVVPNTASARALVEDTTEPITDEPVTSTGDVSINTTGDVTVNDEGEGGPG